MRRSPFLEVDRYPELATVGAAWRDMRAEALASIPSMSAVSDDRAGESDWMALPLWVEEDDRSVFPDDVCAKNRLLAPKAVSLVEALGHVEASSFSSLAPGGAIARHRHERRLATASLCLDGGDDATIRVGRSSRAYADGEWIIFDYSKPHAVFNNGDRARVVLLTLLDLRS